VLYKKLEEYSQTMTMLAMYDALTGLPNRRLLFDRISAAMSFSNRNNSGFSIIYLDLNGFKNINDTHGHDVGDLLLRKVSDRLLSCVRKEDTVARLGGDEFVLLLWDLKIQEGVHDIVMKILNNIAQSYTLNEIKIKITASAGVSIYPLHSDNINTLIKKADMALYESKKISNNNYLIASS
jgi:two-component system, cell cycle response regulator